MDLWQKDDEYKFPEKRLKDPFVPSQLTPFMHILEELKKRKVLLFFMAMVTLLPLLQMCSSVWDKISDYTHRGQTAVSTKAQKPASSSSVIKNISNAIPAVQEQKLQKLQSQAQMQNQALNTLSDNVKALENHLNNVDTELQILAQQIQKVQIDKQKAQKKVNQATSMKPAYYVQAMVAGRAWLNSADGSTITVSVGDALPNYGTVTDIDITQGVVRTSSGREIHYP